MVPPWIKHSFRWFWDHLAFAIIGGLLILASGTSLEEFIAEFARTAVSSPLRIALFVIGATFLVWEFGFKRRAPDWSAILPSWIGPQISWNFDGYLGMSKGQDRPLRITSFQGTALNRRQRPIERINGFIRSHISSQEKPILLGTDRGLAAPAETYGIPPLAKFEVVVPFCPYEGGLVADQGLTEDQFLAEYGRGFSFVFTYDGKRYERIFKEAGIRNRIRTFREYGTVPAPIVRRRT